MTPLPPYKDDPYALECSREFFPATRHGGKRKMPPTLIVIHSTEGGTSARNIASYFHSPVRKITRPDGKIVEEPGGSTHLVVDDTSCFRCLDDDVEPWGAPGANSEGLHIEFVNDRGGSYTWTRETWLSHIPMLDIGADKIAEWVRMYSIPVQFVTEEGLKAKVSGITTHLVVSNAFHFTDHQDPGKAFPMDVLLTKVQARMPVV